MATSSRGRPRTSRRRWTSRPGPFRRGARRNDLAVRRAGNAGAAAPDEATGGLVEHEGGARPHPVRAANRRLHLAVGEVHIAAGLHDDRADRVAYREAPFSVVDLMAE